MKKTLKFIIPLVLVIVFILYSGCFVVTQQNEYTIVRQSDILAIIE